MLDSNQRKGSTVGLLHIVMYPEGIDIANWSIQSCIGAVSTRGIDFCNQGNISVCLVGPFTKQTSSHSVLVFIPA